MSKKKDYTIEMKFEDEEICLAPFVEDMVIDIVLGVARNLKGYEEGQEINICVKKK